MTLGQLFSGITDIPQELTERVVSGVTSDNREVESGFLFVCVKGRSFDGHSVAASMLEKGRVRRRDGAPAGTSGGDMRE